MSERERGRLRKNTTVFEE